MKSKNWLREKRKEKNLTQKKLAKELGISVFTIMQIEQGTRKGSKQTWEKIEKYFDENNAVVPHYSYDSEELILNCKEDIERFGEDDKCYIIYKIENDRIIFTYYIRVNDEMAFDEKKDLEDGESYLITSLKDALKIFKKQNDLFI